MSCIYCLGEKRPSVSHVIPEAFINNGPVLMNAVCHDCNQRVNKELEQNMIRKLAVIRSMFGLGGKRSRIPVFPLTIRSDNFETQVMVKSPGDLKDKLIAVPSKDGLGIYFLGPTEKVMKKKSEYEKKHPKVTWEEITCEGGERLEYEYGIDFAAFSKPEALRLASKIAFEWLGVERNSPEMLIDPQYDTIRQYILNGREKDYPITSIASDSLVLQGIEVMPFPIHYIITYQHESIIVAIVGLFGVVPYKVFITLKHQLRFSKLTLTCFNPQSGAGECY